MFKFFDIIVSFIGTIVDMVISMFEMIIYVFTFIAQGVVYIFACFGYLPSWVQPFVFAVVGYVLIVTILNKGE